MGIHRCRRHTQTKKMFCHVTPTQNNVCREPEIKAHRFPLKMNFIK
jgi:hypothetical protein